MLLQELLQSRLAHHFATCMPSVVAGTGRVTHRQSLQQRSMLCGLAVYTVMPVLPTLHNTVIYTLSWPNQPVYKLSIGARRVSSTPAMP